MISKILSTIFTPAHNEIRKAQEQALERVRSVLLRAEADVANSSQLMTPEQRIKAAEKELEKTEEHLLSALSSMFKALCYVSPQVNQLLSSVPIKGGEFIARTQGRKSEKAVNGEVIE